MEKTLQFLYKGISLNSSKKEGVF